MVAVHLLVAKEVRSVTSANTEYSGACREKGLRVPLRKVATISSYSYVTADVSCKLIDDKSAVSHRLLLFR
jgi:hypothetical protein